ncbi:cysteine desulfurase-like protein [Glaciibacter flavus]|uniref:Cysteine desulfurase-like protein n=1 Tax=Orlajensenia flava TaxID=2565934 RepID=A0A4S4FQL1_9MICO|nr:cysteine desulfurase-like protein [Glaciibacter flavus]THG32581.1 cysteine desulfurase-like protein [Glaciibacter flavus]
MAYDVDRIRSQFPALADGVAHFEGPGGTQTPASVGEAIARTLSAPLSNRGVVGASERTADAVVAAFRSAFADLLGAQSRGIVLGRSATQLVYDFAHHLARDWAPGDEIVVTRLDHDSNIRPWVQAAERAGATVRWVDFDAATGELLTDAVASALGERTRLVAVTAASNLIGTIPDVRAIADAAHAHGALVWVDGVHYAAHELPDLGEFGADFLVCSPYKFLGPHCGVLAAAPEVLESVHPDKLLPSTNAVPERFEFGTLPYEIMAGATEAVDVLAGLDDAADGTRRERLTASFHALHEHEAELLELLERGIRSLPGATVFSRAARRTPTLLVTFESVPAAELYRSLVERAILAPSGNFYALEASRLLGLGDTGGLRLGLAPYTTSEEIDRVLAALAELLAER